MSTVDTVALEQQGAPRPVWEKIGNFVVLLAYSGIVLFTLRYHEKWADEAQAWLLARDLDLKTLWFHELRYEGSPGLWHTILWVAQHVFHARYDAIGYIGAAFAIAGAAVILFATPFPIPIRWLMASSFFCLYQYAVIARSYVLFGLFCFAAARQYRSLERPLAFAMSLMPLALLTAHGSLLAFSLGLLYAVRFVRTWHDHTQGTRRQFYFAFAAILLLYIFLFLILLPPHDVEATHSQIKLTAAVIAHRTNRAVAGALVDNAWLSWLVLAILVGWCSLRKALASFILPVSLMIALYVYADGWEHQLGTVFLAMMAGLAIAWPDSADLSRMASPMRATYRLMVGTLAMTLCYQVYLSFYSIRRDVRLPYSGAADAASFLKPLVANGKVIDGYQYGMVAVNAYFDHNIFDNLSRAYYHHSVTEFNPMEVSTDAMTGHADYIVLTWWSQFDQATFDEGLERPMESWGYTLAHASDGYLLTKTGYSNRQIYLIFRRIHPSDEQIPQPTGPDRSTGSVNPR